MYSFGSISTERITKHRHPMQPARFSLHTHTIGFDATNTIEEMAVTARRIGFSALGISNHFIVYPGIEKTALYRAAAHPKDPRDTPWHGMYSKNFDEAIVKFQRDYEEIDRVRTKLSFPIYKGMEADFFQYRGWAKGFEKALKILKPDYVIGSTHFAIYRDKLLNMHDIATLNTVEQDSIVHHYWCNLRRAVKSGYFTFMAHPDLFKRGGLGTENCFADDEEKMMSCLAETKMPAEINSGSLRRKNAMGKSYGERDLTRLIQQFVKFHIPTMISDDAHSVGQLGAAYDIADACAKRVGVVHYCRPITKNKKFILEKYLIKNQQQRG